MSGRHDYRVCPACIGYAQVRQPVIVPAMAARAQVTGETTIEILDRFMGGVHDRHLAGLPIMPRVAERKCAECPHVRADHDEVFGCCTECDCEHFRFVPRAVGRYAALRAVIADAERDDRG